MSLTLEIVNPTTTLTVVDDPVVTTLELGVAGPQGPGSNIRTFTWVVASPSVGGIPGPHLGEACTVTRVSSCVAGTGTVDFNIEERSVPNSSGVNLMAADQVADANGAEGTSFSNSGLAQDSWLWLDISAVDGSPTTLSVTVKMTTP